MVSFLNHFPIIPFGLGYIDRNPMAIWVKTFEPRNEGDRKMIEKIMANAPRHLACAVEVA